MKTILLTIIAAISITTYSQNVNLKDTRQEELAKRATEIGQINDSTKVFLRGTLNSWGITNEMKRIGDGIYEIDNFVIYNGRDGWKIASEDWHTVDIGGFGEDFVVGTPNKVKIGGDNIFISGISGSQSIRLSKITLDLNNMTLTMQRSEHKYPRISIDYPDDTEFMTNEFVVTPSFNPDVAEGSVKVISNSGQRIVSVRDGEPITIGTNEPTETNITLITIAKANDGTVETDTTTFVKSAPTNIYVYFNNVANWQQPYCYLWSLRGDMNFPWPGEPMTWDADVVINGKRGWWKTQVSKRYSDYGEVIFNNDDTLQTSDDLSMDGSSMYYDGQTWGKVDCNQ